MPCVMCPAAKLFFLDSAASTAKNQRKLAIWENIILKGGRETRMRNVFILCTVSSCRLTCCALYDIVEAALKLYPSYRLYFLQERRPLFQACVSWYARYTWHLVPGTPECRTTFDR